MCQVFVPRDNTGRKANVQSAGQDGVNLVNRNPSLATKETRKRRSSQREFPRVYIFRPAYIYPVEPRREPNFGYRLLRAFYPVFKVLFPNLVIRSNDLARAMVDVVVQKTAEPQSRIFENRNIRAAATEAEPQRVRDAARD